MLLNIIYILLTVPFWLAQAVLIGLDCDPILSGSSKVFSSEMKTTLHNMARKHHLALKTVFDYRCINIETRNRDTWDYIAQRKAAVKSLKALRLPPVIMNSTIIIGVTYRISYQIDAPTLSPNLLAVDDDGAYNVTIQPGLQSVTLELSVSDRVTEISGEERVRYRLEGVGICQYIRTCDILILNKMFKVKVNKSDRTSAFASGFVPYCDGIAFVKPNLAFHFDTPSSINNLNLVMDFYIPHYCTTRMSELHAFWILQRIPPRPQHH